MPVLLAAVSLLGLAVGSFLNVVVHRVPAGQSLVRPASHCPACDAPIRARHNVPVIGWLVLRGRCADCGDRISARYPVVELLTGALFAVVAAHVLAVHLLPALPAYLTFVAAGIALSAIDLDLHRLPNQIVYPTFAALVVLLAGAAALEGSVDPFFRALVGAGTLFVAFGAVAAVAPRTLGFGDAKLAAITGAILGFASYPAVLVGVFAALVVGAVAACAVLSIGGRGRSTMMPFGPALVAGALIALFAAAPVADAYSHLTQRA